MKFYPYIGARLSNSRWILGSVSTLKWNTSMNGTIGDKKILTKPSLNLFVFCWSKRCINYIIIGNFDHNFQVWIDNLDWSQSSSFLKIKNKIAS